MIKIGLVVVLQSPFLSPTQMSIIIQVLKCPPPTTRYKKDVGKDTNSKPSTSNGANTTPLIESGKKETNPHSDDPNQPNAENDSTKGTEAGNSKEGNPETTDSTTRAGTKSPSPSLPELSPALDNCNLNNSPNLKDLVEHLKTPPKLDENPAHLPNESENNEGIESEAVKKNPTPINLETEIGEEKESHLDEETPQSSDGGISTAKEVEKEKPTHDEGINLENLDSTAKVQIESSSDTHSDFTSDTENDDLDKEQEHLEEEKNQAENQEENQEENLSMYSTQSQHTTSPTQSTSTSHPHLTGTSSFSSPSVYDRVTLFNTMANSPQMEKNLTHNHEMGNLSKVLENLKEQIVERIEKSLDTKVGQLTLSLEEYSRKLEKNLVETQKNKTNITKLEESVKLLKDTTTHTNSEISTLKSSHAEMETKI